MLKRNLIIAVIFISGLFAIETSAQNATTSPFQNTAAITINDNANAAPYPSNINVTGVSSFTRMEVRLNGFTHTFPGDVDIILVGPQGQRAILMSDAGSNFAVTGLNLTFAQTATTPIPEFTAATTGTFRPANYQNGLAVFTDTFPAPGPGALTDAPADLFVFNGTSPNGIWNLYIVDDVGGDVGSISGGWTLTFTVPQVFTVTKTADTNGVCNSGVDCSLREALGLAQNGDLINFSALFNTPQTINLLTALPTITRSITIQGTGANLLTVRRSFAQGTPDFRIFTIPSGITTGVAISGMTISGGNAGSGVTFGGGIFTQSHLTLTNVHITGNQAENGGGVGLAFADGVFTNCTFSYNSSTGASGDGGGIFFQGSGGRTLRLVSSTVSGNRSADSGGGIFNISSSAGGNSRLEITNSTITNNTAVSGVVQARRYQNGSNPIQTAGGPTAPSGMFALADEFDEQPLAKGVVRSLRIEKATDGGGQTVTVNLLVDAVGDESEYGFVLNYDESILSSPVIVAGNTGAKARSCNTATAGTINCSVGGFPNDVNTSGIGEITAGGNQILITVTFTIAANAPAETMLPLKLSNVNASNDEATLLKMSGQGVDFIADEQ